MKTEQQWIEYVESQGYRFINWPMGFNGSNSFATITCNKCSYHSTKGVKGVGECPSCNRVKEPIITAKVVDVDAPAPVANEISFGGYRIKLNTPTEKKPVYIPVQPKQGGGYSKSKKGYLYFLVSENKRFCKIGISNVPEQRMEQLRRATPFEFNKMGQFEHDNGKIALMMETALHRKFKTDNCGFKKFDGASEWFFMTPELEVEINEILLETGE